MRRAAWLLWWVAAGCGPVALGPDQDADAGVTPGLDSGLDSDAGADAGAPDSGRADAGRPDAGPPDAGPPDAGPGCGTAANLTHFTCTADGSQRRKCAGGVLVTESCPRGCLRQPAGQDEVCLGTTTSFSCTGSYGTQRAQNGDYFITAFGCWVDASGVAHGDPGDNCIPSCLSQARASGLCLPGDTGKQCEERVTWYTADGARFGCLQRLRITNPANGKAVIAVALDFGPACWVENSVSKAVLDTSGRIDRLLFGSDQGASDRSLVHVVEVDNTTPLGPVP